MHESTSSEGTVIIDLVDHASKFLTPLNNNWSRKRKNDHRRTRLRIKSIAQILVDTMIAEELESTSQQTKE